MATKQVIVGGFPFPGWIAENVDHQVVFAGQAWVIETAITSATITLTGVSFTSQVGSSQVSISKTISGPSGTGQVGSLRVSISKRISGPSGTGQVGSLTTLSGNIVTLTGRSGTGQVGSPKAKIAHTINGASGTGSAGTITVTIAGGTSATVNLTGASLTSQAGTLTELLQENLIGISLTSQAATFTERLQENLIGVSFSSSVGILIDVLPILKSVPTTGAQFSLAGTYLYNDLYNTTGSFSATSLDRYLFNSFTMPGLVIVNPAITGISLSNATFTAGSPSGTVVGTIIVALDSGSFTGSLSLSGTNASSFSIFGNNLITNGVLTAGPYNLNIIATQSGLVGSPFTQAFTVTTTAQSIVTVVLSNASFVGGSPSGTTVGTISVVMDVGSFSGTLSLSGTNAGSFGISGMNLVTNGVVAVGTYNLNIVATQTGAIGSPATKAVIITATGVTQSITSVTLSNNTFTSGAPSGTLVGSITVAMNTGVFSGTLSLSGTDASSFRLSGANLFTNTVLVAGSYNINIIATQSGATGSPFTKAVALTATAAPQSINNVSLSNNTFIGGSPSGTVVGTVLVAMSTGTFSGTLALSGTNAASFRISGGILLTNGVLAVGNYAINIIATQTGASGSPFTRAFTVAALRAMTNITLSNSSFQGGSPTNTLVGAITVVMSSGTFGGTLALSGTNASSFKIQSGNLRTNAVVPTGSYSINITATQAGISGSPLLRAFAITATAPPPAITNVALSNASFVAGSPSGTVVGAVAVTMSSGAFTGTLSLSGTNAASFGISGSNLVTNGVLVTGTYNINIIATQTGATGSPFTKAVAVTGSTSITNITLSNSSFIGGSAANTLVGTIAVTLSSGAFTGTLTLSGTNAASFHISGSNLLTTGVVSSGNYSINIIATQAGAGGSPFTKAFPITGTGVSNWLAPPTQAAAAGFTNLAFYDDFINASTVTLTNSTAQRAFKWYPASWAGNLTSTNVQVNTTWNAGDANMTAKGVSGAGPNASPSGGIVMVQGGASNAALISVDGWITTFPTSGTFKYGYAEAYIQYRPTDISANSATVGWPAWWSWTMEAMQSLGFGGSTFNASPTEVDFWEYGKTSSGNWGGMAFHWSMSGGIDALSTPGFTINNDWHTIGMLWTPGVVSFYYDNVHVGGSFVTSPELEAGHLFVMLGSGKIVTPQSATEPVPMFTDWVRIWTAPPPTITNVTLTNNSFAGGSPDGTVVGIIGVVMSTGSFSGSLSLSGTSASSFRIVSGNLVTNGVIAAGTYNLNIVATQTGATGSPFTKAISVTGTTSITGVTLSSSTFAGGAPTNTVVGAISVAMSSGAFTGTLSLSGANAASFHITGSNLLTTGVVAAGSYAINIIATQAGALGSPFTQAITITGTTSITNVTLSNSSFAGSSPDGTVVGTIAVTMSSGPFSGSLTLSGANSSTFRISGNNLVTNGVIVTGTYNLNIVASQTGAIGSPFSAPITVTGTTSITNVTLSNSSFTGGAPANTVVGAIAVTMSSGAFTGTLSLSGTNAASFHITGSNLLTTGVVAAGSYAINIIATQAGAIGSPLTRAFSLTGASTGLTAPPQAAAAGYNTLIFSDDFTTNTTIAPARTTASGYKWYWSFSIPQYITSSSWSVDTSGTGTLILNSVRGTNTGFWGNSTLVTLPGGAITNGVVPPGTAWQYGYFEAYMQTVPAGSARPQANGWPAFWAWGAEGAGSFGWGGTGLNANVTEIDFMEATGNITFGTSTNPAGRDEANVFNPAGVTNVLNVSLPTLNSNWHKWGCLWKPGNITFYYDDNPIGSAHSDAAWNLEGSHLYLILGTGIGWPLNVDWVRVWQ